MKIALIVAAVVAFVFPLPYIIGGFLDAVLLPGNGNANALVPYLVFNGVVWIGRIGLAIWALVAGVRWMKRRKAQRLDRLLRDA